MKRDKDSTSSVCVCVCLRWFSGSIPTVSSLQGGVEYSRMHLVGGKLAE